MFKIPSFLIKNKYGIYHFRYALPVDLRSILGKAEIKKSLRTSHCSTAVRMAQAFRFQLDILFTLVRSGKIMNWKETREFLDKVADGLFRKYVQEIDEYGPDIPDPLSLKNIMPEASVFLGNPQKTNFDLWVSIENGQKKSNSRKEFENGYHQNDLVIKFADQLINENKFSISQGSDAYTKFCKQIITMFIALDKRKAQYIQDDTTVNSFVYQENGANENITLTELYEKFRVEKVEHEKSWRSSTIRQKDTMIERCNELLTHITKSNPVYVGQISKKVAVEFKNSIAKLPSNITKRYKTIDLNVILSRNNMSDSLDNKTANRYIQSLCSMFNYAISIGLSSNNPFDGLTIKIPKRLLLEKKYKVFDDQDLSKLYNSEIFTNKKFKKDWKYWVPIIALYTGARIEEICQLQLIDICDEGGIKYFNIEEVAEDQEGNNKKLKTTTSYRKVPVHSTLIQVGIFEYLDYVKNDDNKRVFPELNNNIRGDYSHYVSRWFNENVPSRNTVSYKTKCGIIGERKVFHSLRKSFTNCLKQAGVQMTIIDELNGHGEISMSSDIYANPYNMKILKDAIEKVDYPGACLPWDTNPDYNKIPFPWSLT